MIWIIILLSASVTGQYIRPELQNHRNWKLLDRGDDCGHSDSPRIIGGTNAGLGEYPWIVRLGFGHRRNTSYNERTGEIQTPVLDFACGGSIISNRYILTAAHCMKPKSRLDLILVRLGEHDVGTDPDCTRWSCAPSVQDIMVEQYISHNYYVPGCEKNNYCYNRREQFHNDITLVRLVRPIKFNDFVYPVCLPVYDTHKYRSDEGSTMVVAGWGIFNLRPNQNSRILQKLTAKVVHNDFCNRIYEMFVTQKQVCAGGVRGQGPCFGDSGGPLVKAYSFGGLGRFFLIGVVSFGQTNCVVTNTPSVYIKVAEYMEWILNNIRP